MGELLRSRNLHYCYLYFKKWLCLKRLTMKVEWNLFFEKKKEFRRRIEGTDNITKNRTILHLVKTWARHLNTIMMLSPTLKITFPIKKKLYSRGCGYENQGWSNNCTRRIVCDFSTKKTQCKKGIMLNNDDVEHANIKYSVFEWANVQGQKGTSEITWRCSYIDIWSECNIKNIWCH